MLIGQSTNARDYPAQLLSLFSFQQQRVYRGLNVAQSGLTKIILSDWGGCTFSNYLESICDLAVYWLFAFIGMKWIYLHYK